MRNGFLNFMSEFRKTNCKQSLKKGAEAWCKLSKKDQKKFRKDFIKKETD